MPSKAPATTSPQLSKGKMKKMARLAAMQNEKQRLSKLREAASRRDLLEAYPAFRCFERDGVAALLEGHHGADLKDDDVDACVALQHLAAGDAFDEDAARSAILHEESRVLLMRAAPTPPEAPKSPPPLTESMISDVDEFFADDEWDLVPEAADLGVFAKPAALFPSGAIGEALPPAAAEADERPAPPPGTVLGYLHLQFCVANREQPLLCVLNMQLDGRATGKGLGKFALQLVELMALQNGMELVMMYMRDGEVKTMRLSRARPSQGLSSPPVKLPTEMTKADGTDTADEGFELISWPTPVVPAGGHALSVRG